MREARIRFYGNDPCSKLEKGFRVPPLVGADVEDEPVGRDERTEKIPSAHSPSKFAALEEYVVRIPKRPIKAESSDRALDARVLKRP